MKHVTSRLGALGVICAVSALTAAQTPLPTGWTYQGQLKDAGAAADGDYDMRFALFNAASGRSQAGPLLALVGNGTNSPPTGVGRYTALDPRLPRTTAPYALRGPGTTEVSNIRDFGAEPGGSASENHAAIQAAIAEGEPGRPDPNPFRPVYIPPGTFDFDAQINNPYVVPMFGPGVLRFTGSGEHAVVFGAVPNPAFLSGGDAGQETVLHVERHRRDWNDEFAGVALINVHLLRAHLHVRNFAVGVLMQGTDAGCNYNLISLQQLWDNRVGIRLHAIGTGEPAAVPSSVNQNTFIGGSISTGSLTFEGRNIHGVEFKSDVAGDINGNLFLNPSFELVNGGPGFTSAFHGSGGKGLQTGSITGIVIASNNVVSGMRFEGTDYVLSGKGIVGNEFRFTRGNPIAELVAHILNGEDDRSQLFLALNHFVGPNNLPRYKDEPVKIAEWGRAQVVDTPTGTMAPAIGAFWRYEQETPRFLKKTSAAGRHVLRTDHIQIGRQNFPGVLFDLRNVQSPHLKRIDVKCKLAGNGGRFAVVLFADEMIPIQDDEAACNIPWSASVHMYETGGDMTVAGSEASLAFGANVAYAFVGVNTGAFLQHISYFAYGQADVRLLLEQDTMESVPEVRSNVPMLDTTDPVARTTPRRPARGNSYSDGTFVRNIRPVERGDRGNPKYVVLGWIWNGTAWLESRALTGN